MNTFDKLDLMMTLTTELPVLRARLGISQETIAQNIGLSRQTYCAIENGTRKMTWTIFMALVAFFDLNEATSVMLDQIPSFIESIREILRENK
ncbi:helix-turn-helix transcriptional regulator [Intestinibacillus sp. Marseille-P6563]|uniref:helix-turn-helix transcriptional regulator n=1 Tax=Intestinibacillus sp. Marseille-P6563 TaxID=2364792 RepID=UPI000F04EF7B|nr:helix-turn-helix domain-containing protein [Intestinibacillus sp. Marseille-P6563]